jgi:hypothetical protein
MVRMRLAPQWCSYDNNCSIPTNVLAPLAMDSVAFFSFGASSSGRTCSAHQSRLDLWNLVSVTEQNSSSPDTERDIVAVESYGSQLGRVIDALAELITEQPEAIQNKPALRALIALRDKIERIKSQSAAHRLERIAADLAQVKRTSKSEYQRLSQKLRDALNGQDERSE